MVAVSQEVLNWLINVLRPEYSHVQRTFDDVAEVLSVYKSLRPKTDVFTSQDGQTRLLLLVYGSIPIDFRGSSYLIPIHIWLPQNFPRAPPTIFVVPSAGMQVRPNNYVDIDRRCYHPYLANWTTDVRQSRLCDVIRHLQDAFSRTPPIYSLPPTPMKLPMKDSSPSRTPPIPAKTSTDVSNLARSASVHESAVAPTTTAITSTDRTDYKNRPAPALPPNPRQSSNRSMLETRSDPRLAAGRTPSVSTGPQQPSTAREQLDNMKGSDHRPLDFLSDDKSLAGERATVRDDPEVKMAQGEILNYLNEKSHHEHNSFLNHVALMEASNNDLMQVENQMSEQMDHISRLTRASAHNASILREKIDQARKVVSDCNAAGPPDIDQCLVAQNIVFNQLYDLVTSDRALEDVIYALGHALENERIELDVFLKAIKQLAREQFMHRALIVKITEKFSH